MITKVRFPGPVDVLGDGRPVDVLEPGKDGVTHLGIWPHFTGAIGAIYENGDDGKDVQKRVVVLPLGTIVNYNDE